MQIPRTRRDPSADAERPADVRHRRHATGGTARRSTAATRPSRTALRTGEHGKLRLDERRPAPAGARGARRPAPASPATSGSGSRCCTRCSCSSTTRSATACTRSTPTWADDAALRPGPARQRGADGEDPHGRVDAGDHRRTRRRCTGMHATGGASSASASTRRFGRLSQQRAPQRHPRLADEPPRRALLAHRGVRRRLPDAPAAARRLHVPRRSPTTHVDRSERDVPRARRAARARRVLERGARSRTRSTRSAIAHPGAIDAAQLPALPAAARRGPTASSLDLAAVDILRTRERGVPRYNEFRELFHLKPRRDRSRS